MLPLLDSHYEEEYLNIRVMRCIFMNKIAFFFGVGILFLLAVAYFIPMYYSEQEGSVVSEVQTRLLGEMIFYNPFVLGLYVLIAVVFIVNGWNGKKK